MPKKVLITLSLMGAALCNQDYMKTVFAEESRPSALLERSSVKIAITMENLNLRDKASTSGRILTTIPKGKTVTILSEKDENGWYKVSYDGKTGYVSRSYLTTSNSTPAVSKTGTATENLNLRDQPGTSGKILTTIPKGKTVTILSEKDENGWYKVSYGGKTGYVSGSYLTTSPSGSTTITTKTGTATENLNLRNQASLSGKILTTIPKGKTVTILSEKDENGWYKVSYDGKTGYAISNYIKEDDSNSEATESAPSKPTVSKTGTTTENLNLRNQASLSGKVLMTIPKGKTVTILSEKDENGWYKVSYDGKTGYAISNYIKEGDSNSESTESTPSTPVPIEGQPTENLNLRDQPSTSGKILTTIPKGKTVTILSEKNANGWYKVSYNGKTGYVSGSYFKVTKYEELEETVIWTGTVNTNESIVYKTADTSATTLTAYHAGQKVEVVKVQGDWVRIKYNDTYAWMLKKVVTQGNLPNSTILWDGEIGKDTKLYATKSTTSTVLNSLTKGTVVYVIEEDGDWLKIKHHDGYGYVQRVTVINLSIPTIPENILWTGKTTENLNVRNYPDVSGILLGTLTKGTIIEVVSEDSKGWLKIKYEHGYGYVNGSYVQKDDSQTPETPETTKQIAYVYNLDGGTLNVRPQPNTSQSAIGKLSEGEAVTIVGESGNWYEIEYNNSIAYVSKDYITFTPITPETPEITKQIAYVYNLDGGTLNVRPQPNTN
ncbi:SH3 domain-containing protein, partial [Turicibacter bilis]